MTKVFVRINLWFRFGWTSFQINRQSFDSIPLEDSDLLFLTALYVSHESFCVGGEWTLKLTLLSIKIKRRVKKAGDHQQRWSFVTRLTRRRHRRRNAGDKCAPSTPRWCLSIIMAVSYNQTDANVRLLCVWVRDWLASGKLFLIITMAGAHISGFVSARNVGNEAFIMIRIADCLHPPLNVPLNICIYRPIKYPSTNNCGWFIPLTPKVFWSKTNSIHRRS